MDVQIHSGSLTLPGSLTVPTGARGLVLFAHGSGSSRFSPRNIEVAERLNRAGFATLLFDLLTESESQDRSNIFDIPLLSRRLSLATRWAEHWAETSHLPLAYFGASTGAAAALWSAAEFGAIIRAVVCRGGRPDLAERRLKMVSAPTLLVVGEIDKQVLALNFEATTHLRHCELVVIPGASHLFEEPGTLPAVAEEAIRWFNTHLLEPPASSKPKEVSKDFTV
ncbi:MAG: dienelactone hydrolase family protein [Bdellovibrionales bacterium]|nr:dienelactone hydrolase family protein [Bdellovibrionales bacterium]